MGYRSQVVLAIGIEAMPQFMSTMAKSPEAREMCFAHTDRLEKDYDGKGNMLFYWSGIKWYDSYEGVHAIQDFLDWACEEVIEIDGQRAFVDEFVKFIRTGEEMDDNESRGCGFDDIYITRSIEF